VRSLGGEELIFPNSDLADSRIQNFRRMFERRVVTTVGLVYETEESALAEAPALLREAVEEVEGVRFDRAHFKSFGASSLDFELVYFVLSKEYPAFMDAQQAVLFGILRRLRARGLEVAFPTRTVHVASMPEDERAEPA
jgi:small-conductance mechanosensitive channel